MKSYMRAAAAPTAIALLVAFFLADPQMAASRPKKAPEPVVVAPPPPPPVVLSSRIVAQAGAYHGYLARAAAISPAFTDGPSVARSLRVGAAYEPSEFLRGAVAYGAVAAMQDPTFMQSVRAFAVDPTQRAAIAAQLRADPAYAGVFHGADSAAGLVITALGDEGLRLYYAGKAVKQSAYDVQHSAWSKADIAERPARLADTKTLSSSPLPPAADESARLLQATTGAAPLGLTGQPSPPPYTPVVLRSLAVAALAALGQADDNNAELLMPLLSDPLSGTCLSMAKLNLYQCLAVAKPHYEDIFCLGQHAMMDTGQCLLKASGAPVPDELKPKVLSFPPIKPAVDPAAKPAKKAPAKKRKS